MPDLLDDILPVAPHPDVNMSMPPLDLDVLERDWSEGNFYNELDAVRNAQRNIPLLIAELRRLRARPSPNGAHGYETTCHGCGAKITVKRRPVPDKHNWCETCTANGEPAADRARRYRDRKREGRSQ